jgi:hypothetical protein
VLQTPKEQGCGSGVADLDQFSANPEPSFHLNADPDPDPTFHFNADLDPSYTDANLRPWSTESSGLHLSFYFYAFTVSN